MTPMAGNSVMDLLLGKITPRQANGISSQAAGQTADGAGFADLLGMLTGLTNNAAEMLMSDSKALQSIDISSDEVLDGNGTVDPTMLDALMSNDQAGAITPNIISLNTGLLFAQLDSKAFAIDADTHRTKLTAELPKVSASNFMQLPTEAVLANPQVLALLNQMPVELPTGRFAVLSSKVTDGSLQMEVASQDAPNQKIKLTIPTALLHQTNSLPSNPAASTAVGIAGQSNIGNRVPLTDQSTATERFDQLLSKVNVKEIEIAASQIRASVGKNSSQVAVTLIAENNGISIAISGRLNKDQLLATKQRRPEGLENVRRDNALGLTSIDSEEPTIISGQNKSTAAVAVRSDDTVIDVSPVSAKSNDSGSIAFTSTESSVMLSKGTRHARATSALTSDRPAVRMTIQQELPNLAQLEGRTLMIKLEPEYLGPARLHLTMRDDTLSARVMVETTTAKSAVESSLSQLTDQLTKAGIKVDYIDVGVRGGGAQNQFFHRQTDWFREQHPRMTQQSDHENVLVESAQTRSDFTRPSYVSADRVNIYA